MLGVFITLCVSLLSSDISTLSSHFDRATGILQHRGIGQVQKMPTCQAAVLSDFRKGEILSNDSWKTSLITSCVDDTCKCTRGRDAHATMVGLS